MRRNSKLASIARDTAKAMLLQVAEGKLEMSVAASSRV
jgi:hypothetical protein